MADIESACIETTLTHEGKRYAATIVTINSTELGREDHGFFTFVLHVTWGGSGTGIGQRILDGKPAEPGGRRTATAVGMQWIMELIETVCGFHGRWEDLPGKRIFMLHDIDGRRRDGFDCRGIASLDGRRVMIFNEVEFRALGSVA